MWTKATTCSKRSQDPVTCEISTSVNSSTATLRHQNRLIQNSNLEVTERFIQIKWLSPNKTFPITFFSCTISGHCTTLVPPSDYTVQPAIVIEENTMHCNILWNSKLWQFHFFQYFTAFLILICGHEYFYLFCRSPFSKHKRTSICHNIYKQIHSQCSAQCLDLPTVAMLTRSQKESSTSSCPANPKADNFAHRSSISLVIAIAESDFVTQYLMNTIHVYDSPFFPLQHLFC